MRNLTFTIYPRNKSTSGEVVEESWSEWCKLLTKHAVRGSPADYSASKETHAKNKNGPAVVLGIVDGTRAAKNVREIHALAVDVEDVPEEEIEKALQELEPFEYFIYTTHKNGSLIAKGFERLRIVLPLLEPIQPKQHKAAWKALDELVNKINDPSTKDLSRLNYLPSTFDPQFAHSLHHPGRWISIEDLKPVEDTVIEKIKRKLKAIKNDDPLADAARRLAKGEPIAEPGHVHNTALALTQWIGYRFQELTESDLIELFEPSVTEGDHNFGHIYQTYVDMVSKIRTQRLETQLSDTIGDYDDNELSQLYEEHPEWDPATLLAISQKQGWTTINEIKKRWAVQQNGTCWFLQRDGTYSHAVPPADVVLAISRFLSPAPVETIVVTEKGAKPVQRDTLFARHASLAARTVADLTQQHTIYEPKTQTLREAICPIRSDLKPVYNENIDGWLKVLGGPSYGKLVDWLSVAPDLSQILCAIYFAGCPGSGKTLFAYGVARLWRNGPPGEIDEILKGFNEEFSRCPLILADESIPQNRQQDATAILRSMLSTTSRSFKRKFRGPADLIGAVRLVLAANNEFLLQPPSVTTRDDTEAIAQRFLVINAGREAVNYIESQKPDEVKNEWLPHGIAQHTLWLQENHEIAEKGKRFVVQGDISKMARSLTTRTKWNAYCYEWIVTYLMSETIPDNIAGFVQCADGELYICNQALIKGWKHHLQTKDEPDTAKINAALRTISLSDKREFRRKGKRYKYYHIDQEYLLSWSEQEVIGDREEIIARIRRESMGEVPKTTGLFSSKEEKEIVK